MKTMELAKSKLTVIELIELAEKETLILKKPDGTEFVLSASFAQCERSFALLLQRVQSA